MRFGRPVHGILLVHKWNVVRPHKRSYDRCDEPICSLYCSTIRSPYFFEPGPICDFILLELSQGSFSLVLGDAVPGPVLRVRKGSD